MSRLVRTAQIVSASAKGWLRDYIFGLLFPLIEMAISPELNSEA